jgi:hypothetical protein
VIEVFQQEELPLTTAALYKNIIWSASGDINARNEQSFPLLYRYIQYRSRRPPPTPPGGACSPTGGATGKAVPDLVSLAMQAGVHVFLSGQHPLQNAWARRTGVTMRWPLIVAIELEPGNVQTGDPDPEDVVDPPGTHTFAPQDLCVDVIDYAYVTPQRARTLGTGNLRRYCPINAWRSQNGSQLNDGMRSAVPFDANFPQLELRPEVANAGRAYAPNMQSLDVEVYNPYYFRVTRACQYVADPRPCFQPIYLLGSLDTQEATHMQPIAFWTTKYENVVSSGVSGVPGAVGARSVVFSFPPVYFNPSEVKAAIEYILFDEWQLPRRAGNATSASASR